MLTPLEKQCVNAMRKNSRMSMTELSNATKTPLSTMCNILTRLEKKVLDRHTTLVSFQNLGYSVHVNLILASHRKNDLQDFLACHPNVNNLTALMQAPQFQCEVFFKTMKEFADFKEQLETYELTHFEEFFVSDTLRREGFFIEEKE